MKGETIASTRAAIVAEMRALHRAKERAARGRFLLEGENALSEALAAGLVIHKALVDETKISVYDELLSACPSWNSAPIYVLSAASEEKTPQGILAVADLPVFAERPGLFRRLLALDGVQDPGNVGAIIRLCAASGWDGVLVGEGSADPYAPKVVRSSAGLIARVPIWRGALPRLLRELSDAPEEACSIAVTAMNGDDFYAREHAHRLVLVVGNEARGVSEEVRRLATHCWALPMPGGAESLNAAMVAGIMVYDELRRDMHAPGR